MKKLGTVFLLTILSIAFSVNSSSAQEIGFKGVGGRLGYADANGIEGTIVFGAHVHLGEIIENLVLMPSIDFWTKSFDTGVGGADADFSSLAINANARYYFPAGGNIDFFAVGGLAIIRFKASASILGQSVSATTTEIGLNLGGGAEIGLSDNLVGTAQLIYLTEGEQIKIMVGVTFMMGE